VGDLFKNCDAPSFFVSSFFRPQAAAKTVEAVAADVPQASGMLLH
jgi:hypothetical protein